MGNPTVHRVFWDSRLEIIETIPESADLCCNRVFATCLFSLPFAKIEISTDIEIFELSVEELEFD